MSRIALSDGMRAYFEGLDRKNNECYELAERARKTGKDPETFVEVPRAEDLASRVEELLRDYDVKGIAEDIRELTDKYGNREVVSLMVAGRVAKRPAETREKAIDRAIRAGLAVLTEGILVAPLEGLADTKVKSNPDGSEYIDLMFAGPIRAAGGTAQAMSVLIADVVRQEIGIGEYQPTRQEVDRFIEEIPLYKQCQHIQYSPSAEEIRLIVGNCPICIDGEGTERVEISGFRDLPRIETNRVRGGACLVVAEGMCQKASKLQKHVKNLNIKGWGFMDEYLNLRNPGNSEDSASARVLRPSEKYLADIVAGRPIFGHPSRPGGFRLRYGRGRTCGLAALAFNPASMYAMDEFPALGTQVKTERPGKACVVTPCDALDGPILLLKDGSLIYCDTKEEVIGIHSEISEIIDNGEILVPFGEFCENNHFLVPCGYNMDWHKQELAAKGDLPEDWESPSWERAKEMSKTSGVPLHPGFNLFWSDITMEDLEGLRSFILLNGTFSEGHLSLPREKRFKKILENLGALHGIRDGRVMIGHYALPLLEGLGLAPGESITEAAAFSGESPLEAVSRTMGLEVRSRGGTRIGTRMARPEKSKDRRSAPMVHGLFPVGDVPAYRKELNTAIQNIGRAGSSRKTISIPTGKRKCPSCGTGTFRTWCRDCDKHTDLIPMKKKFGEFNKESIGLSEEVDAALSTLKVTMPKEVKVLDSLISRDEVPESIEKGILRAIYDLGVNKDGTLRYDMTDLPLTHFKPSEIGLPVEKAVELGYTHDMNGAPLTDGDQMCELKVQDVIPNVGCGDYMVRVSQFTDDLLENFYGQERYYNVKSRDELLGHLIIGLAPHTSGGILCRIIGYTDANGAYAHPFFHASKRRNCDGDEDSLILLLDGLLNFSRSYLPNRRGGLMDAPLVLTTRLDPNEIDKEAHNIDCLREYPLELYRAAEAMEDTKGVEKIMDLVAGRIGTERQYEGFGFTHDTRDISEGPKKSAYTTLVTMEDKMNAQLHLGKKIRAVDECDVATRVINKHFLPDMAGNLRSFSAQTVRCAKCGEKYRRVPLNGRCICGNNLILTVHEASVKKYLEVSKDIGRTYGLSNYTLERIEILEMSMASLFDNDKVRKCKLTDFM